MRIPAVLFSFLLLFYGLRIIKMRYNSKKYCFLFLVLYTILPYFTMQSRFGLDCNLMLGMSTVFLYYYIKAIDSSLKRYFLVSSVMAGFVLYTYALSYIVLPIFLFISICYLIYIKRITFKQLLCLGIPLAVIATPLILVQIINFFNLPQIVIGGFTIIKLSGSRGGEVNISQFFFNIIVSLKSILLYDWIEYNTSKQHLTMYWISLLFIAIGGIYSLINTFKCLKAKIFSIDVIVLFWAFSIFFMGCFLGGNGPNTNKLNGIFFAVLYLLISGLIFAFEKDYRIKKILFYSTCVIYFISYASFTKFYFTEFKTPQWLFADEYSASLEYLDENLADNSSNIYIDSPYNPAYIYYLGSSLISPYEYNLPKNGVGDYNQYKFHLPSEIDMKGIYIVSEFNTDYLEKLKVLDFNLTKVDTYFVGHSYR